MTSTLFRNKTIRSGVERLIPLQSPGAIVRPGDFVKVVRPHVVYAVGYENQVFYTYEETYKLFKDDIEEFIRKCNALPNDVTIRKITFALAKSRANKKYPSPEKKLFKKNLPILKDAIVQVQSVFVKHCGVYHYEPGYYDAWSGEGEPTIRELQNRVVYKILAFDGFCVLDRDCIKVGRTESISDRLTKYEVILGLNEIMDMHDHRKWRQRVNA